METKGLDLDFYSVKAVSENLQGFDHPEKEKILATWNKLVQVSFAGSSEVHNLKQEIANL